MQVLYCGTPTGDLEITLLVDAIDTLQARTQHFLWSSGMSISGTEVREAAVQSVAVSDEALTVDLADGRTIIVPVAWFPRLAHGTVEEQSDWRLIGGGNGIHWPRLDEDISVESLLLGRRSGE